MDSRRTAFDPLVFLLFLVLLAKANLVLAIWSNSSDGNSTLGCIKKERDALLTFRQGLKDHSNALSSWIGHNCCNWFGVSCSNQTGHVIELDLHSQFICTELKKGDKTGFSCKELHLGGKLSPSLLELNYLSSLDLHGNDFRGISIPNFVGSLRNLRYLDLSGSSFSGMVPSNLGNLSKLLYLDLNPDSSSGNLWVSDLYWLSNLSSLQYLNIGSVNLSKAANHWLQTVNTLPSLLELHLPLCQLHHFPESPPSINLTSLSVLDLNYNYFNSSSILQWWFNITTLTSLKLSTSNLRGPIPEVARGCLCNLHTFDLSGNYDINGDINGLVDALSGCSNVSLEVLDLSSNQLKGSLPNSLGYLKHLRYLFLNSNSFSGPIPPSLGDLTHLEKLDLSNNVLNGTVLESIGQLGELESLRLFSNSWEGIITEVHFMNLTKLLSFSFSSTKNSSVFKLPKDWIPPFNLVSLVIIDCTVGPAFPLWLRSQTNLGVILTLSGTGISDILPDWFSKFLPSVAELDLSRNNLRGDLSSVYFPSSPWYVNLSFNKFEGSMPLWRNVTELHLKNNKLSGPIPLELGQEMPQLEILDLSGNFLNGSIPPSISKLTSLINLDLSNNSLSGEIHSHWRSMKRLRGIYLSRNNFSGRLPSLVCSLPSLTWLRLNRNYLSGELSLSLQECSSHLITLDLGENRFSGTIPNWIGKKLSSIAELRLRSNFLTGTIPEELCQLTSVHILDLAQNNLSGPIPACLDRLAGFKVPEFYFKLQPSEQQFYPEYMDLVTKGRQNEYTDDQTSIVNAFDLSRNNLSGEIPAALANLSKLGTLNLSRNQLTGNIPDDIGDLKSLETLDLSCNHLEGPIPTSMASLTSLSHLNLSNNNLSGPIPSTNQFQTFNDPSIYEGNPGLCGSPLPTMCSKSQPTMNEDGGTVEDFAEDDESKDKFWFYVSMGLGFIMGFWTVCGSLAIKKSWREAYFRFFNRVKDRLLLVIAINVARFQRMREVQNT